LINRLQAGASTDSNWHFHVAPLATALAAEIAAQSPCLLVLDDYHLAATPPVDVIVQTLLGQAPALTLAITARTTPNVALPRLRLQNQLTEITAAELRFAPDEVLYFLRQRMQVEVTPALSAELTQRAEGWVGDAACGALAARAGRPGAARVCGGV